MILQTFKKFGRAQLVVEDSINQFNTIFRFKIAPLLHLIFMKSESQILQKNTNCFRGRYFQLERGLH